MNAVSLARGSAGNRARKGRREQLTSWLSRSATAAILALACMGTVGTGAALAQTTIRLNENAPGDIDPARSTRAVGAIMFFNLYDTLLLPGEGGQGVQPHLAESYEVDGSVYTFHLRKGVKFSSGNEMTAEDVVFSLERLIAIGAGPAPLFSKWVQKVEAIDDHTVRITTEAPYAPLLAATFRLGIIDKKTVVANLGKGDFGDMGDYGQGYLGMNSAGTGAYRVVSHNPQAQSVLEKNPDYFLPIPAEAPDRAIMSFGVEQATQVALMRRGELDIMSQWASPETKRAASQIEGVEILSEAGLSAFQIKLNTTKAPLDDVHCRRALAYALDYETLAKLTNVSDAAKGATLTNGSLLTGMRGHNDSVPNYARDMEKAKAELAQCAYQPADYEMDLIWFAEVPIEERFALLMQQNFGELGFKTQISRVPLALYYQSVADSKTTPHISQLFSSSLTPDPDSYLGQVYGTKVHGMPYTAEWLTDDKVDELLDKGRGTIDPDERAKIYGELDARLRELQPTIWAFEVITTYARSARVRVPLLEEPGQNMRVPGMNMMLRMMKVVDGAN